MSDFIKNRNFFKIFQISKNGQYRSNEVQKHVFHRFYTNFVKFDQFIQNIRISELVTEAKNGY